MRLTIGLPDMRPFIRSVMKTTFSEKMKGKKYMNGLTIIYMIGGPYVYQTAWSH